MEAAGAAAAAVAAVTVSRRECRSGSSGDGSASSPTYGMILVGHQAKMRPTHANTEEPIPQIHYTEKCRSETL